MPNKRAENINRVTVTVDKDFLKEIEDFCRTHGINRLVFIREAMEEKLTNQKQQPQKDK